MTAPVVIHDMDSGAIRTVASPEECTSDLEKSGVLLCQNFGETICIGTSVFEPVEEEDDREPRPDDKGFRVSVYTVKSGETSLFTVAERPSLALIEFARAVADALTGQITIVVDPMTRAEFEEGEPAPHPLYGKCPDPEELAAELDTLPPRDRRFLRAWREQYGTDGDPLPANWRAIVKGALPYFSKCYRESMSPNWYDFDGDGPGITVQRRRALADAVYDTVQHVGWILEGEERMGG